MSDEKKVSQDRINQAEQLAKEIGELESMTEVENLIKDNEIKFKLADREVQYRIRMPNYEEQRELEKFRRKKYLELIQDESIKFQKEWIEIYKKKGIDIVAMEEKVVKLGREEEALMLKLAETSQELRVNELKEKILKIRKEISITQVEKTDLLSYSLEDLLMTEISSYIVSLVLEKLENDKYVKVFKDYDECSKSQDSILFNKSFYYSSFLQMSIFKS